jgi:hypothetical protein
MRDLPNLLVAGAVDQAADQPQAIGRVAPGADAVKRQAYSCWRAHSRHPQPPGHIFI